jgi:hypothetical protein
VRAWFDERIPLTLFVSGAIYFRLGHPHIRFMANWQRSFTREPAKTKAELRQMLTEAVRNTPSGADHAPKPKAKAIAAGAASAD